MAIGGELKNVDTKSSAQLVPTGTKVAVLGMHYRSTGTKGTIELKNGGSGGTSLFVVHTPPLAQSTTLQIPAGGIHFDDGVYADLSNVDGLSVWYQEE